MSMVRVHATTQAGRFKSGPLVLTSRWSEVDAARVEVRAALVENVGHRVKVHPLDVPKLAELGITQVAGRLVERPAKPAAKADSAPPSTATEERSARGGRARG